MDSFDCFPIFFTCGRLDILTLKNLRIQKIQNRLKRSKRHFFILLLILHQVSTVNYRDLACPHPTFVAKHHCNFCVSSHDALIFSHLRNLNHRYRVRMNHVFGGETYYEFSTDMQSCRNVIELKAWHCNTYTRRCQYLGPRCFGRHDMSSGHLFYREIYCL